jgi:hypothetical protein
MGYGLQRAFEGRGQTLRYGVARKGRVVIRLFDSQGRLLSKLVDGTHAAGSYSVALPDAARGSICFVDFRSGNFRKGMKIVP